MNDLHNFETLPPRRFRQLLSQTNKPQLIDVRGEAEAAQKTGIRGAGHLDFNGGMFNVEVHLLDKSRPVFVYCQNGRLSEKACHYMAMNHFKMVYHLRGGLDALQMAHWKTVA